MAENDVINSRSLARKVFTEPGYWLAFGFGSGLTPWIPGTAGSLVGVVLFFPLSYLPPWLYAVVVLVAVIGGSFICGRVASHLDQTDPGGIVLDEIVGIWVALFMVPSGWYWVPGAFILFRGFDILKPWPVNVLDREVSGGLGIMVDDVAAGLYTFILLQGLNFIINVL